MRLSAEEIAMLHAIAEKRGVTSSDVVRIFIRETYAQAFGDKKPPKSKK